MHQTTEPGLGEFDKQREGERGLILVSQASTLMIQSTTPFTGCHTQNQALRLLSSALRTKNAQVVTGLPGSWDTRRGFVEEALSLPHFLLQAQDLI